VSERKFVALDGRIWVVSTRPYVRKDEIDSHVTLEFATNRETRVVSCRRDEWEVAEPDLAALLARSVASGASRQVGSPGPSGHHPD
jgi:hypothetical protein